MSVNFWSAKLVNWPLTGGLRIGHGSGPSMGRVGSSRVGVDWVTKFSVLDGSGWVGSNVKNV